MTLVSIIIPTYNREVLIERAIQSVLNQTYENIELIVVDDGSTDKTREILKIYIHNDRIKYFKKENGGCASARNFGINKAEGKYLGFLDSDDTYKPDAIKNLVETLSNCNADFVFSPVTEIYPDKREIVNYPIAKNNPENFASEHLLNTNVYIHACLFKKTVFEKESMDEQMQYNEDSDFLQRVAINHHAVYCNKPSVNHYHHQDNKSKNRIGILNALLYSLNKIRLNYPSFYMVHTEAVERRYYLLNKLLIKQYILNRDFKNAKYLNNENVTDFIIQLSILIKSPLPLKIGNKLGIG